MKKKLLTLSLPVFFLLNSCNLMKTSTGLIVYNAKIYTVDPVITVNEAMAVNDGKVLSTGSTKDILGRYRSENMIDAGGKAVFPGFIDAHCHFYGYALNFRSVVLNGCNSFNEVLEKLKKAGNPGKDGWIVGRGWDQNLWKEKVFPDCKALDDLFPDNPVVLSRIDGHVVLANSKALLVAGIGVHHAFNPVEVEIKNGRLTGILSENAADHMKQSVPKPNPEELQKLLSRAREDCFSVGLTTVSDAGLEAATVGLFDSLSSGKDSAGMIRIYAMLEPSSENISKYIGKGIYRTPRLFVGAVKVYSDGSLGSRTALLKQQYHDMPGQHGIRVITADSLRKICRLCLEHGYQVNTHAIGDSANKFVLDIYGEYLVGKNDRRWRIEHCQVVDPSDLEKFRKYSVVPSVQATHATSDMGWAKERLGDERIRWAYAYKELMKQNGWIANGTDFPIENISPVNTFYAAVARKDIKGNPPGGFQPENALSREEALRSITIWAARADCWEDEIGSLEPGKNADFVILDRDIMQINESEIPMTRVTSTYLSGKQVYKKP
jgi:predicted amidohydrolase YtcJ